MNMETGARITMPLSGRGKPVVSTYNNKGDYSAQWGNISFMITSAQVRKIMRNTWGRFCCVYALRTRMM